MVGSCSGNCWGVEWGSPCAVISLGSPFSSYMIQSWTFPLAHRLQIFIVQQRFLCKMLTRPIINCILLVILFTSKSHPLSSPTGNAFAFGIKEAKANALGISGQFCLTEYNTFFLGTTKAVGSVCWIEIFPRYPWVIISAEIVCCKEESLLCNISDWWYYRYAF